MSKKPLKVLAFVDYYLPGFKGGGPIASVSRLITRLDDRIEFYLFTRDHDLFESEPFDVERSKWTQRDDYQVYYANNREINSETIGRLIGEIEPDILYANSYFSIMSRIVLHLHRLRKICGAKVLVAPRGEFSPGALAIKRLKKWLYLRYAKYSGLHHGVVWQVSSEMERTEARNAIRESCEFFVLAPDLSDHILTPPTTLAERPPKRSGCASFVFLSRISPKKNLDGALEFLRKIHGDVEMVAYGPAEDKAYWQKCLGKAESLPPNIRFEWRGPVAATEVREALGRHHFMLFPTHGENFGHVIPEALSAGCPILLSDQTPWQDLAEKSAGWVMPLSNRSGWHDQIQACVDMDEAEYEGWKQGAIHYIEQLPSQAEQEKLSENMFHYTLAVCETLPGHSMAKAS